MLIRKAPLWSTIRTGDTQVRTAGVGSQALMTAPEGSPTPMTVSLPLNSAINCTFFKVLRFSFPVLATPFSSTLGLQLHQLHNCTDFFQPLTCLFFFFLHYPLLGYTRLRFYSPSIALIPCKASEDFLSLLTWQNPTSLNPGSCLLLNKYTLLERNR